MTKQKYEAGGLVTIKLSEADAEELNLGNKSCMVFPYDIMENKIVKYEPPAFDWSTVRAGMAFRDIYNDIVYLYSGPWLRMEDDGTYTTREQRGFFQEKNSLGNYIDRGFGALTRAQEHDIEVKE